MDSEIDVDIKRLEWDSWNVDHIASHAVSRDEVEQVVHGRPLFRGSYKNRVMAIGPTPTGRMLTVVLGPVPGEPGVYYTFSARPASRRERARYQGAKHQQQGGDDR